MFSDQTGRVPQPLWALIRWPSRTLSTLMAILVCLGCLLSAEEAACADGYWTPLSPPSPRHNSKMCYDPAGDRYFLFGGLAEDYPTYRNDLWVVSALDRTRWVMIPVQGPRPTGRWGHFLAFDPVGDQLILYGGFTEGGSDSNVWTFSLSTLAWTMHAPSGASPDWRGSAAGCIDADGRQCYIGFGDIGSSPYADLWSLDLESPENWTLIQPTGPSPSGRTGASLTFDPSLHRLILFGGDDGMVKLNDVWLLPVIGPATWSLVDTGTTKPSARSFHSSVIDPSTGLMVVFGGRSASFWLNDVWTLSTRDPSPVWAQLTIPTPRPISRSSAASCWDTRRREMILATGFAGHQSMSEQVRGDWWALRLEPSPAWVTVGAASGFYGRSLANLFYDKSGNRLILYGGLDKCCAHNDIWYHSIDESPEWLSIQTSGPPARFGSSSCNAGNLAGYLFGGWYGCFSDGCFYDDLWRYSFESATWSQITVTGVRPSRRWKHSLIFDELNSRLLMFGGLNSSQQELDDLWAFDLISASWQALSTPGARPTGRQGHMIAVDTSRNRMWMFGGATAGATSNELWYLDFSVVAPVWVQVSTFGTRPSGRSEATMVYDSARDRLILFGGSGSPRSINDAWELLLSGTPIWRQLSIAGEKPSGRRTHLAVYDDVADQMIIATGDDDFPKADIWSLKFSSASSVVEDRPNGHRGVIGIERMAPNPSRGSISFAISNRSTVAAELYIVDVAGRRVRALGKVGASDVVNGGWDGRDDNGVPLVDGIYFLCAANTFDVVAEKFVLLR